jgi:hypothetical protein
MHSLIIVNADDVELRFIEDSQEKVHSIIENHDETSEIFMVLSRS